jgi:hypothetical protein
VDGHVTLIQVAELGLVEDGALECVVVEEVVDGRPQREGVGLALLMDDLQDLVRANGEDPVNNALINLFPIAIALDERRRSEDVAVEPKLVERGVEEHAPVRVVGVGELQGDRNVSMNVHGRCRRWGKTWSCGRRRWCQKKSHCE